MPKSSPYIKDIVGRKPNWLIRSGIGGLLVMLTTMLFLSWFIKYPDIIKGEIYISTPKPPIDVISPISAKIVKIFDYAKDDIVSEGSNLILLNSTADFEEIKKLEHILNYLGNDNVFEDKIQINSKLSKLGDLQNTFNTLTIYIEEFNENLKEKPFEKQIKFLTNKIHNSKMSLDSSKKLLELERKDFNIAKKRINRTRVLHSKGVITELEYEIKKQKFIQEEIQLEKYRSDLISKKEIIGTLQKQLSDLKIKKNHSKHELKDNINNIRKMLIGQIDNWKNLFLITSPINGTVSVFKEINEGDFVTAGSYILTILPPDNQELFAYGSYHVEKAGTISVGDKAIIKLDAYPYREYGSIDGHIEEISDFPIEGKYSIKIKLPQRLNTGFKKNIQFKQRLTGNAELISNNRSLLSRIFYNFKYPIENN